jgi:hypothetical protein
MKNIRLINGFLNILIINKQKETALLEQSLFCYPKIVNFYSTGCKCLSKN